MDSSIATMLSSGIAQQTAADTGFLSRLFLVSKPDGWKRPIFNLKRLNAFLRPRRFRLISHFGVPRFLQPNYFLVKLDLSQAYNHVSTKESHRRFLVFSYRGVSYNMTCLPFGLASAPQIFAAVTNWVAAELRRRGMRVIV